MDKLPVLFIGHGNPMNAIVDNAFSRALGSIGKELPRPTAILCISAHWTTGGAWVTHMAQPKTIHDFGGFPQALFDVQYPAPGSPEIADLVCSEVKDPSVDPDDHGWGLDHGAWSILKHMYPAADVPVVQLSIDDSQPASYHFNIGKQLKNLRDRGVLIVGSGNVVHNLKLIDFQPRVKPLEWAVEFDAWVKERLEKKDYAALMKDATKTSAGKLAVPTPEHWYPLFYVLGASDDADPLRFEYEAIEHGSISMRSFRLG